MPRQFIHKRPLTTLFLIAAVCFAWGVVVTRAQASAVNAVEGGVNNKHLIPNELNPKLAWHEHQVMVLRNIEQNANSKNTNTSEDERMAGLDTIHSIAMRDNAGVQKPIYDYTTGTSN